MKWKVAKENYMHIRLIEDEVMEYDQFLRRQETKVADDPEGWKEEEKERWNRDEDGNILIEISNYGYIDDLTDTPWDKFLGLRKKV